MSSITPDEIKREFIKSRIGMIGIGILATLITISIIAALLIPVETFQEWNNPSSWI
jgi:peptide/nickel transport system permease protein